MLSGRREFAGDSRRDKSVLTRECGFGLTLRVTSIPIVYLSFSDTLNPVSHVGNPAVFD